MTKYKLGEKRSDMLKKHVKEFLKNLKVDPGLVMCNACFRSIYTRFTNIFIMKFLKTLD